MGYGPLDALEVHWSDVNRPERARGGSHRPGGQVDQPRTLIRDAALILTMDPTVGAGELGIKLQVHLLENSAQRQDEAARRIRNALHGP